MAPTGAFTTSRNLPERQIGRSAAKARGAEKRIALTVAAVGPSVAPAIVGCTIGR
jgi:hypothetical protein